MSLLPVNTPNFLRGFAAFFYNIIWLMKNSKLFGFTTALILSLRQEHNVMCSHLRLMRGGEVPNIPTHPSINRWCCQRTACTKCCQRGIYIDNSFSETRTHVFTFTTNERGWGIKHPHSSLAGAVSVRLVVLSGDILISGDVFYLIFSKYIRKRQNPTRG